MTCLTQKLTQLDSKKSKPAQNETHLFEIKRHLFKYQISLSACFYYSSTELRFLIVAGMLSCDALPMDIGAKYFDGNSCLLELTTFVNLKKFMECVQ